MNIKVAVIGGGVAGMSAAHELIERGFDVAVYEKQPVYVGGKARSVDAEHTAEGGRKPLPGEHGFRFFPGFYKHITDTMKRIPFPGNINGVFDNLVQSERVMLARFGKPPIVNTVNFPKNRADLQVLINAVTHADTGVTEADKKLFANKLWQVMSSSYDRRQQEYERISWWQFMETDQETDGRQPSPYEEYFVGGLTHTLVAAQPKLMSTKTGGDMLLQLLFLMLNPTGHADRVLNGPTNEAWLFPWLDYLKQKGVAYYHHHEATAFHCDRETRSIKGVMVKDTQTGEEKLIKADYYISAVPLERMAKLVNDSMIAVDTAFDFIDDLAAKRARSLNWMSGIQYYLREDVQLTKGHVIFIDSPWAVTAISQLQFWKNFDIRQYGNGEVKGILSVDVSDWFSKGLNGKSACDCSVEEIIDEVWNQMEKSLNVDGQKVLDRSMIITTHLDCDIRDKEIAPHDFKTRNAEPLLVNTPNSWSKRPEAYSNIKNFFLAADYVRTHTDLATMEGANEAARRAVNGIITASGANVELCNIWPLHEPNILAVLRWLDRRRYERGLPWTNEVPWLFGLLHEIVYLFHKLTGFRRASKPVRV
ncbi:Phytoene dehydrogenase [Fibrisoma limi BUZ 3]|uniref:Phytoene dehydrogenase n=1 Tax=Fibrisoma limi BUZ 3 TaxID=1185876 RepID=I2GKX1_9BACT|nr:FAD-dependent oxidoreductase [Fibrisoma limi]CCH54547.1 Phytoene dehydrogenase [Fibrisoma limi BUZ 3]